jgi:sec-independent protein translocase protein TatC
MAKKKNPDEMSFLDHLEELRWRIFKCLIAVGICAVPCGVFWKEIFDVVMIYPLRLADPQPKLIYTSPAEAIILSIKIAITGGIIAAAPVVFYQIWRFISPGLYKKEKVVILPVVFASTLFFLLGIGFAYFTVPFVISFLTRFAAGKLDALYRSQEYLGFLIKLAMAFGVVFELPVLSYIFTKLGFLTPKILISKIRYAIVIIFILAAILTPPDVVSQVFLAVPLLVLYGISIVVSFCVRERKK